VLAPPSTWSAANEAELRDALKRARLAEQKIEAIRGLIPKLKCDRCVNWVGEPCPETCDHLIFKKIREVLGVLEVQEKKQQ